MTSLHRRLSALFPALTALGLLIGPLQAVGPVITVTKDDGVPAATLVPGGTTLTYTNTISNTGSDATGVQFLDPDVAHTTTVVGSLRATPLAIDDTYPSTVVANSSVDTSTSGFNVLTNDFCGYLVLALGPSAVTVTTSGVTAHGGTVAFNTGANKGTFVYTPAAGYTGADSFTYTIDNGVSGGTVASTTGTVSLIVGGPVIWFVNPNVTTTGNGTLSSPFKTLAEAVTAIGANTGQKIFLYTSGTAQTGNFVLKTNGWLVGQAAVGTSFDVVMGVSYPGDTTTSRPSINNATKPSITNSAGNTITLGEANTILGVAIANTGVGFAISGSSINAGTIGNATTSDVTIGSSSTSSGAVSLTTAGNGSFPINAPITTTGGHSVNISGRTAGAVTFSQVISDTGTGINLTGNTGATINFTGGLSLSTGANIAFNATGGGSVTATQNNTSIVNTITTTTGNGLVVIGTTIGSTGLTFRSITVGTATGSAGDGIILDTTGLAAGNGGLTVTGNGNAATHDGGTIQHKTGADGSTTTGIGIYLNNTKNVSLTNMALHDFDNFAVFGNSVSGFTLANGTVNGTNGTSQGNPNNEGSLVFKELTGTASITNCTVANGITSDLSVINTVIGSSLTLNISGSTFTGSTSTTVQELLLQGGVNAGDSPSITANITTSTFTNTNARCIQAITNSAASMTINIGQNGVAGSGGTFNGMPAAMVDIDHNSTGDYSFNIQRATFNVNVSPFATVPINIFNGSTSGSSSTFQGRIVQNSITGGNNEGFDGITMVGSGPGTMTVLVDSNSVTNVAANGISYTGAQNSATNHTNLTITNNTLTMPDVNSAFGVQVSGQASSSANSVVEALISGNNVVNNPNPDYRVDSRFAGSFLQMPGYTGAATDLTAVKAFVAANNKTNGVTSTSTEVSASAGLSNVGHFNNTAGGAAVPVPGNTQPLLFASDGVEGSADLAQSSIAKGIFAPKAAASLDEAKPRQTLEASGAKAPQFNAPADSSSLSQDQLDSAVFAALTRWEATGLTNEQVTRLRSMKFEVAAMNGDHLGETSGDVIHVSKNAGGNGWFIDASAQSDALFGSVSATTRRYTDPSSAPAGKVDLLTTILHEMGHALGLPDTYRLQDRNDIMYGQLTKGERRLPGKEEARGAVPFAGNASHFLSGVFNPITIGTLPAGKSVIITYQVTLENPITPATTTQISSQATAHSTTSSFADVTSNNIEGATPGSGPTITLLAIPPAFTNGPPPVHGVVGTAYGPFTYTATGAPAPTFSATGLPTNLTLSTSGTLSGTPTAGGVFSGTTTASNGVSPNATQPFTITIAGPPVVSQPSVTGTASEGTATSFTVSGTFTDPVGAAEGPFVAKVNWGDASTPDTAIVTGSANPFSYSFTGNHTYAQSGSYNVTVTVTNTDNQAGTSPALGITVANVAPTVSTPVVSPTTGVVKGASTHFTVSGSFSDPAGALDAPFTGTVNWGDATTSAVTITGTTYSFSGNHTYATAGTKNVTVTITDKDSAAGVSSAISVLVIDVPTVDTPTATSITSSSATLGGTVESDGGSTITTRGVVYSTVSDANNPKIGGGSTTNLTASGTTGAFTVNATPLTLNTQYFYAAYAINAAGTTYTSPVSTFTTPNVTYALGTSSIVEGPAAGTDTVVLSVTPQSGTWTASTVTPWLHTSASGTGSAIVPFTFDANASVTRTGTLNISGQTFTVTQAGVNYGAANPVTALVSSGIGTPYGMTLDSSGNVYFADQSNKLVKKWTKATNTVSTLDFSASPFGAAGPSGIAVDSAGNVYVTDTSNNAVKKWTAPSTVVTLDFSASPLSQPLQVALDSSNNLYVADSGHSLVKKWTAPNVVTTVDFSASPNASVTGVAVDAGGNIYAADNVAGIVKEKSAATGAIVALINAPAPTQLAVDGSGNVYAGSQSGNQIIKWTASTQTSAPFIATGLSAPLGVAVDADENVYISDSGNSRILEKPRAFVDPTAKSETFAAGSDALPPVLPTDTNLLAPFAPTSDQTWLTLGSISSGVVNFNFALNATTSTRSGNLTVLGVATPVNQGVDTPNSIAVSSGSGQSATVNTAFTNPLKALVKDAANNPISGVTVTFTAPGSGAGGTFAGGANTAVTDATGNATSAAFTANTVSGSYTVTASVPSVTPSASFSLTNNPGTPTSITASGSSTPQSATVNTAFGAALVATVRDTFNNPVSGVSVTFTSPSSGASGAFSNTTATITGNTNSSGQLSESFTANIIAGAYSVTATAAGVGTPASFSLTNNPGAATQLAITTQPSSTATAGVVFGTQPVVKLEDQFGNVITTDSTHTVTAARGAKGSATLQPFNPTLALVNGVATFSGLFYDKAETMNLQFTTTAGAFTNTSTDVVVSAAAATTITQNPGTTPQSTTVGTAFTNALAVTARDVFNNPVPGVSVTFTAPASTGTFSTSTNTITGNTDASGVISAPFTASSTAFSVYQVTAAASGLGTVNFSLTNAPGAATQLAITTQPSSTATAGVAFATQPVVKLEDQFGNVITTNSTSTVTAATGSKGSAVLQGANKTLTLVNGVATFSGLSYNKAETMNLLFTTTAGAMTNTSTDVVVSAAAASLMTSTPGTTPQTTPVNTGFTNPIGVKVTDASGNPISGVSVTFTAPASGASSIFSNTSNTITGTTDATGVVSETITANTIANPSAPYTVSATAGGLPTANFSLTNVPGVATRLEVTTQPSPTATAGVVFGTQPVVKLEDSFGNVVIGDSTSTVTVATGSKGSAVLQGSNKTLIVANGVATFSGLSYNKAETMNLGFSTSAGAFINASSDVVVSAAAASLMSATAGTTPQTATVNTAFTNPIGVKVTDAFSNPIQGVSVTFTAPASGASANFSNSSAIITGTTDLTGVVSESVTANTIASAGLPYTVSATSPGLPTASFSLTNNPGAAAHFAVSATSPANAGSSDAFTVTAQDSFNNTVTGYTGTVAFSSTSDAAAVLPGNSTLTAGTKGFNVTFETAGSQTVTATDTVTSSITGISNSVTVSDSVSISPTVATAVVGGANGAYTFSRSGNGGAMTVNFQLDAASTATEFSLSGTGVTYNAGNGTGTVIIPNASTSATVTLTAANATGTAKPSQTVQLDVASGSAYNIGSPANATVTITQNGFVVFNTSDSGQGSLRQAILNADALGGNPTITFDPSVTGIITLTSGALPVTSNMTIQGPGANVLQLHGNLADRVFAVNGGGGGPVFINGFSISAGHAVGTGTTSSGGAIIVAGSTGTTISNCEITQNTADTLGGALLIVPGSTVHLVNSTISGNSGTEGGAVFVGGNATFTVINSTISGNTSSDSGGGIYSAGHTILINSTVTNNTAPVGSGIFAESGGTFTVGNSIIAANKNNSTVPDASGTFTSQGNNLIGNGGGAATGFANGVSGDQVGTGASPLDPMTGSLANNGGPTLTHALLDGSPAINAGSNTNLAGTQHLFVTGNAGTFVLGFNGSNTAPLAFNTSTAALQLALNTVPAVAGAGNVSVSGAGPFYSISFNNPANAAVLTATGSGGATPGIIETYDQRGVGFPRIQGPTVDIGAVEALLYTPTLTNATTNEDIQTTSGLVITPNSADGGGTEGYQITGITNGTLYQNDGVTTIANGSFITAAQGSAGLKFTGSANFFGTGSFNVQTTTGDATGLVGSVVGASISIAPVADTPTVTNTSTVENTQTTSGLVISRNVADGTEVALFKITNITNGTLFQNNGITPITNNSFITFAQGNAGLKFTPANNFLGQGTFQVQGSIDDSGTGLSPAATATITVGTLNPTPLQIGTTGTLNRQTGLFQLTVNVTNTTPGALNGFRLHVDYSAYLAAFPTLKLFNASSAPGASDVFVNYPYPVATNATVAVNLEFQTSNRLFPNPFSPTLTVDKLMTSELPVTNETGIPITKIIKLADKTVLLEWTSVAGHWYRVSFSSDMHTWFDSPTPLQAGSNQMQWIDSGPPFTSISPADPSVTSRFYIVNEIPTP